MFKNFNSKFLIFIALFTILSFVYYLSANYLDNRVNDFMTKVILQVRKNMGSDNVVIVAIDDKSIEKVMWPWQRDLFSNLFDFLEFNCGAKSIVFQNLIAFPDSYNPEKDTIFYNRIKNNDKLINSFILVNSTVAGDVLPQSYLKTFEAKNNVNIVDKRTVPSKSVYKAVFNLPKEYLTSAKNFASSILSEDNDTILRSYMPIVQLNDKLYPSLALSAYSMSTGIKDFVLYDKYLCSADDCKSLKLPVFTKKTKDYLGNTIEALYIDICWYTPISQNYTHKMYSASDLLVSYYEILNGQTPRIPPETFKDKIVIVGLNADKNVWNQLSETPVLKHQSDIDVHATAIDNMLSNVVVKSLDKDYTLLITVIFSLFIVFGFTSLRSNLLLALLLSTVYFIYAIIEFLLRIYVPPITPIITIFTTVFFKKLFTIMSTDKTSELIKRAMGKYVSKDVMKKVLSDYDKLKVGGVRSVATILFVDIRDFTPMAEKLSPQDVTSILNEYFSTIEPIIAKYNGIINKYMGDGVLAVFGEPIKDENHVINAIKCGMEITQKVKILREKFVNEGKPKIEVGIGINTGEVFVGNIGTEERLEYTVIGDNVNLAYRIEAFNKILKTCFLISQYSYEYVKDRVDVVRLSQVEIKGKSKPIDIYEVLNIRNER